MPKKLETKKQAAAIRRLAEQKAGAAPQPIPTAKTESDVRRLLHELEVHQVELEMQNNELRLARDEAEALLEKFSDLYEFAPVGYFTINPDGTILQVNLTATTLVKMERSRIIGKSFSSLLSPEQRPAFQVLLEKVFNDEIKSAIESVILSKDPSRRDVNIELQRSSCGRECRVAMMDISQRKYAEEAVHVSEIRYRRLFEAAHDGVLLLDPATRKITDANPFMSRLLGYTYEQFLGKELYEIGLLGDESASREMFQKLKVSHRIRYEDLPLKTQAGRHQEVEVVANLYQEGSKAVIQCNIRDITARKLAEDALRRNEALFSALIDQAPIGIYLVNAEFCVQQVNPIALHVFKDVVPLIGRDFSEIVRSQWKPQVAKNVISRFRHTLKTGEAYISPSFSERRRDLGVREDYEWQIQRVGLPAGEYGVVCFFINVTERKRAEETRRKLELLTASNLKLKEEVSRRKLTEESLHETRVQQSVLLKQSRKLQTQLRSFSHQLLHVQEEERKRISRELHDIIAQTLVGINVHLATLSKSTETDHSALRKQILETHKLVENAVSVVHRFARELRPAMLDDLGIVPAFEIFINEFITNTGIRVKLAVFPEVEQLKAAIKIALFRVFQEALNNVVKHAKSSEILVRINHTEGVVQMEIRDNGQGFEVNGKGGAKRNNRLGLLGMRERVEMIGGEFRIESTVGVSTSVFVQIPDKSSALRPHV